MWGLSWPRMEGLQGPGEALAPGDTGLGCLWLRLLGQHVPWPLPALAHAPPTSWASAGTPGDFCCPLRAGTPRVLAGELPEGRSAWAAPHMPCPGRHVLNHECAGVTWARAGQGPGICMSMSGPTAPSAPGLRVSFQGSVLSSPHSGATLAVPSPQTTNFLQEPVLFFFFKILFIFKDREREGERDREKNQSVASHMSPNWVDGACNPGMCAGQESNRQPFTLWNDA